MVGSMGGFKEVTDLTRKHFQSIIEQTGNAKSVHAGAIEGMSSAAKAANDGIDQQSRLAAFKAKQGIIDVTAQAKESGDELIQNAERVGAGIGKAMLVAGGVFAAKGIFDFVSNSISKTLDLADSFATLEKQTGLSTKSLAGLKFVAEQSDTSLQALSTGAMNLERTIGAGGKAAEKLREYGITSREPLEAMLQASEAIARAKDPMEQATIAQLAFKQSWKELMPVMKEGSVEIGKMMDAGVKYYGNAAEMAKQAEKLRDSQAELKASMDSLSFTVAVKFIPDLEEITSASALAAREEGLAQAFIVMLGGVMKKTWDVVKLGWDALAWALQQSVEAAFLWPLKKTQEFTDAAGKWAGEVGDAILAKAGEWKDAGAKLIDEFKAGISANLRGELGIGKKIAEAVAYIKSTAKDWFEIGKNVIQGLLDGIYAKYHEVIAKLKGLGSDMLKAVKDVLSIHSPSEEFAEIGKNVADGFQLGILRNTPKVVDASKKMAAAAKEAALDKIMSDSGGLNGKSKSGNAVYFDDVFKENRKQEARNLGVEYAQEARELDAVADAQIEVQKALDNLIDRIEPAGLATRKFAEDMEALTNAALSGNISLDRFAELSGSLATGKEKSVSTGKTSKSDEIAAKYASGQSIDSLAKEYGMSEAALKKLIARTDEADTVFGKLQATTERAFHGMEDAIVTFVKTGKLDFSSLADSIITDLIRIQVQEMMTATLKPLMNSAMSAIGSFFFEKGGVPGGTSAWRNQIVDRPTMFAFAKGGVMGEAGPEAIMPLKRGPDGTLGVRAQGGGGGAVNVSMNFNIDATGADAGAVTRIEAALRSMMANFKPMAQQAVREALLRNRAAPGF
jgi:lambda family phage tail tape measure protein